MTIRSTPPTREVFIREHLAKSRPTVVRGQSDRSRTDERWTFKYLVSQVGTQRVPLYNDLFDLVGVSTFGEYCDRFLDGDKTDNSPYLRWFARQSDQRLPWSDSAFKVIADTWSAPTWMPAEGYVFPNYPSPIDVTQAAFPAKGIFVCPGGGMTSWHVDPWQSDAVLFQEIGSKRLVLYRPDTPMPDDPTGLASTLGRPGDLPANWPTDPLIDVALEPGDCIFIPQTHPHAALALEDSLSITWNFVHESASLRFEEHRRTTLAGDPVLKFFSAEQATRPEGSPVTVGFPPNLTRAGDGWARES